LMAGLRADGMGVLVPVSRAISRADNMRNAARDLRDEINEIRAKKRQTGDGRPSAVRRLPSANQQLATSLLATGCVKFGQFKLKSGLMSPIYMDLRQLVSHPKVLAQVAAAYAPLLDGLSFDRLAALPYAALPIGTAISLNMGLPLIYPRKEAKAYGTKADIEGAFAEGETAVVIDDLTTTGDSKFEAIEKLTGAGLKVTDVVVLIDRQSGAKEAMAARGVALHAVVTLSQLLDEYERGNLVPAEQIAQAREFLKGF
ncbi:MAG TPA: orotate phosphoribosyltransferase, partial [Thermoflexales bacterium]|nr:orotate phosphoribosyltransferase [Thermoflexales bacterium]